MSQEQRYKFVNLQLQILILETESKGGIKIIPTSCQTIYRLTKRFYDEYYEMVEDYQKQELMKQIMHSLFHYERYEKIGEENTFTTFLDVIGLNISERSIDYNLIMSVYHEIKSKELITEFKSNEFYEIIKKGA